jgi:DNA-binding FrmR family transcriptional regulator
MSPADDLQKQMQADIQARLRKIEGQIRGLQGMIAADKDCEQILTQARAAHSALKAVCNLILKVFLVKCYGVGGRDLNPGEEFSRLNRAINMLSRFMD